MFNWIKKSASIMKEVPNVTAAKGADLIAQVPMSEGDNFKKQGDTHLENKEFEDAAECFRQAVAYNPSDAETHYNMGLALKELGQINEAAGCYQRALEINHDYAEAHYKLGNVRFDLGCFDDAVASYRKAVEIKPDYTYAHINLGNTLKVLKQFDEAVTSYRRALAIEPGFAVAHYNLGIALQESGRVTKAVASYLKTLELQPGNVHAHINLGNSLAELERLDEAVSSYQRALAIKPDSAEAHYNLGNAMNTLGLFKEAVASFCRAIELKPDYVEAHFNLGNALSSLGQHDHAVLSYLRAVEIKPDYSEAHNNLGTVQRELGQISDAVASFRRALEINPGFSEAYSGLLYALNYVIDHSPSYQIELARRFGRVTAGKVGSRFSAWQCKSRPERLRVGLVSGDLRDHVVGYFLEGVLAQINPARIELFAYSTSHREDEITERLRPCFSEWKSLTGKSDAEAAWLIHDDGVHVLLDISGHTAFNRLPVFSWKPAPVQASWLGYFATTGVAEMDYLLADEMGVPESQRAQFSEKIWYLPDTRLCFTPPKAEIPVTPLPALSNGMITFGCFQDLPKVGDEVLAVWGEIFAALPDARLRMQCKLLGERPQAERMLNRLQRVGISSERVKIHGRVSREAYLAAHAEVDMILDTFPYPGGTTTCEAFWMGVPTLTLSGDRLLARQGAGLLTSAGLSDWVVESRSEYIGKAIELAGDLPKLSALRAGLRQQVSASPIFDGKRFAQNLEHALWGMWGRFQEQNSAWAPKRAHPNNMSKAKN